MFATSYVPRLFVLSALVAILIQSTIKEATASPPQRVAGDPRIALPPKLFAAVGVETNIYFENVLLALNPAKFAVDIECVHGRQQSERWTWKPTAADVGDHDFRMDVRDEQNCVVASTTASIHVAAASRSSNQATSLLLVGDSLTHVSIYSQHLLDLSSKTGTSSLRLIGSHCPEKNSAENRHEGYGGWTAARFATHYHTVARQGDYKERGSPFLYEQPDGSPKLDFHRYCEDVAEGHAPDVVTFFLGPNDIFWFNDDTIEKGIVEMLDHLDRLILMIREGGPATQIGILLPVPPAATQDAFGSNYGNRQTRWQYRRNQHAIVEQMIKRYADRESDRVHLVSTHTNLDCVHNYPTETVGANVHSEQKLVRQNNGVHPSPAGYRQIGDSIYAWLMSLDQ